MTAPHARLTATVLVVGAGPVGLTLAMDLAWRGIDVTVAETRAPGEPPNVKCNHVAARSMEIFRRLGVVNALRNAGLPEDYPNDISYRTAAVGEEITRIPIPCRRDRYTAKDGPDTWWPTPEPPHRINQIYIEPILFAHAAAQPKIRILSRTRIESFVQNEDGVVAAARDLESDETFDIECTYMIGCDGGRSEVRRQIGARLEGDAVVQRVQSTFIRAPKLISMMKVPPAWSMFTLNPRRSGNIYSIDGRETWLVHNYLRDEEADFDSVDRDWAIRTILGVDSTFEYSIISKEDWFGRRLVANRFRDRRVFICGDAAHLWVPYAGYGMNAGIADAANLAWLMAAHLKGWAPAAILDAHEQERQPITQQVSHFAMKHAEQMSKQRRSVPADIEKPGPEGDALRAAFGQEVYALNVQQYCCAGLNFGYFYDGSPLIAYDGEAQPGYSMDNFKPSTVPGCRVPHLWLDDGRSLYDALGPDYTLLRFDPRIDVSAFMAEAASAGVPIQLLDVMSQDSKTVYDRALVLARPDQHVAWRGNACPSSADALIDLIRGRRISAVAEPERKLG